VISANPLSTINQHPFTHRILSVYLRQCTSYTLFCKASFLCHGLRKWTQSCHKVLFQSRSICVRNTSICAKGLWEWCSEPIKRFRRYSQFRDRKELAEDDERCGRPKSTRTEVNIAAVTDLVKNDRQIASRMIAEPLNFSKTVVLRILKEDLGKRELCARFFPHILTPELREDRVTSYQGIITMADADNFF